MESSTSRLESEKRKREEIQRKIALLENELSKLPDTSVVAPSSPKRKSPEPSLLAPSTPSPKKKRKVEHLDRPILQAVNSTSRPKAVRKETPPASLPKGHAPTAGPSNFLSKLKTIAKKDDQPNIADAVTRSSGFADRPESSPSKRDEDLALVEDFAVGPYDHKAPFDDPYFEHLEPHSGIRLLSRIVPHEDFQDYLRGRVYLSPSRLYSCVRILPDKQAYDVPVPGDWVTIAVVAERGPIKFSKAPVGVNDEDGSSSVACKGKDAKEPPPKPTGKKYVNIKLIDFGARSRSTSGSSKAAIRGDAFLTLLLFEADTFELMSREEDGNGSLTGKMEKIYKGGSGGAFEKMSKVKEGDVIALLNPKILKPFQRSNDTPHPVNNVLAITPSSAASILVLGRSKDLGMCTVVKRDGKVCGSWCDKRISEVCEFHVQTAVERRRASRPEFSIGTSGMSTTAVAKKKPAYDPARQWGLAPVAPASSVTTFSAPTYVVSGHVISSVSDNIGREGQAKAQRQLQAHEADRALKKLLQRDKEGMKAVVVAREAGLGEHKRSRKDGASARQKLKDKGKGKEKETEKEPELSDDEDDEKTPARKPAYSAEVIKQLGFDPTAKFTQKKEVGSVNAKLEALASLQSSRQSRGIDLGPRPGPKHRTSVKVPIDAPASIPSLPTNTEVPCRADVENGMIDLDDL